MKTRGRRTAVTLAVASSVAVIGAGVAVAIEIAEPFGAFSADPVVAPVETPDAFSRPQLPEEKAAESDPTVAGARSALTADEAGVREDFRPGSARSDTRVLLRNLGESRRSIFAFTTEKGILCLGLTNFTSGCYPGLPPSQAVTLTVGDPDQERMGEPGIVWGYARGDVKSVAVSVWEALLPAVLGDHAYFFQLPSPKLPVSAMRELVVTLQNGDVQRSPIIYGKPIPGLSLVGP